MRTVLGVIIAGVVIASSAGSLQARQAFTGGGFLANLNRAQTINQFWLDVRSSPLFKESIVRTELVSDGKGGTTWTFEVLDWAQFFELIQEDSTMRTRYLITTGGSGAHRLSPSDCKVLQNISYVWEMLTLEVTRGIAERLRYLEQTTEIELQTAFIDIVVSETKGAALGSSMTGAATVLGVSAATAGSGALVLGVIAGLDSLAGVITKIRDAEVRVQALKDIEEFTEFLRNVKTFVTPGITLLRDC